MNNNEKFFLCIKNWLTVFLPKQRCLSENSIKAYKMTLNLLIEFLRTEKELSVKNISFDIFDKTLISNFIEWLESVRKCSISTQNSRLMALRSFFHYAAICDISFTSLELEILKVPVKKSKGKKDYVFYTITYGIKHQMSEDNAEAFMKKYGKQAHERCNEVPERVHPHQLRHTRAIHLYRSGMPLPFISELLGHVNMTTTNIYAYADTEMKRKALEKAALSTAPAIFNQKASWENDEDMILKLSGLR